MSYIITGIHHPISKTAPVIHHPIVEVVLPDVQYGMFLEYLGVAPGVSVPRGISLRVQLS